MSKVERLPTPAELIDELGDVRERLARSPVSRLKKRERAIVGIILAWMQGKKATATSTFAGSRFTVRVSACSHERQIKDLRKLFDRLGKKRFLELCSFTLKALEDHVPLPERAEFITETQTGARDVETLPREEPAAAGRRRAA
jgi:hypothetical protein